MIGINVNMPKNCQECPCLKYGEYGAFEKSSCAINHKIVISNKKRPIKCPLVELKGEQRMKLVIDIPDTEYKQINEFPQCYDSTIVKAIANGTPLEEELKKIRKDILEEKEYAYADFEQYKVDYLGIDSEYVCDELPNDDFRYGMERCIEIIDRVISELKGENK